MIDAVRYLVDNGIKWRAMPSDFPPWPRVYASFFTRWRDTGLVAELHDRLRGAVRGAEGRDQEPSAAIVDSQSVKADATVALTSRGFDAGKKINGRKRRLLTDTLGLLLAVEVIGLLVDVVAVATFNEAPLPTGAAHVSTLSATVNAVRQPRWCSSSPTSVSVATGGRISREAVRATEICPARGCGPEDDQGKTISPWLV
ncbi:transposase [Streptomyces pseudogriseolus]|uniref:transposase n=1 Tax=Streptomyces pseudogriseolus TaxID=36817 RepID=UPI003FA1DC1F